MNAPRRNGGIDFLSFGILFSILLTGGPAQALPRFALSTGQPCASCHVSAVGGAMRSSDGWSVSKSTGIIDPGGSFLAPLYSGENNTLFTEDLSWGFDFRQQLAKRYDLETNSLRRKYFSMQIEPYVSYRPVEGVEITGAYNFVKPEFPEQQRFLASVSYLPLKVLRVEAGYLLPDVGVQHDDHTVLTRNLTGMRRMWQELGGQVSVMPLEWLTVIAGLFGSEHRRKAAPAIHDGSVMGSGKVNLQYADYDSDISLLGGASTLQADGQSWYGAHAGIGWIDRGTLMVEFIRQTDDPGGGAYQPRTDAFGVHASYDVLEGLALTGRYERAAVHISDAASFTTTQYVIGAQIFPVPFLELRPEYRYTDNAAYTIRQYTAQLHIFY